MAQTISAYAGYKGKTQGLPPKIGFLLGTRKMQLPCAYFSLGTTVRIRWNKVICTRVWAVYCEIDIKTSVQRHVERI